MEGESPSEDILTPGYQPLLTPSSYENLRANNGVNTLVESTASSRKSEDVSPYAYEKLAESPNNNVPDNLQQKKENDLYESCSGDIVIQQENIIYESMETEPESYEPILGSSLCNKEKTYENEDVAKELKEHQTSEQNIYEDVQVNIQLLRSNKNFIIFINCYGISFINRHTLNFVCFCKIIAHES